MSIPENIILNNPLIIHGLKYRRKLVSLSAKFRISPGMLPKKLLKNDENPKPGEGNKNAVINL